MSVVKLRALELLGDLISNEITSLGGKVCAGAEPRGTKLKFPSVALISKGFTFHPFEADSIDNVRNIERTFGPRTAVFEVGTWVGRVMISVGSKSALIRYQLEHEIEQIFLGNADLTAADAQDIAGKGYLRPGITLIDVPDCDNARCAFEMENGSWFNEKVFANEWYSHMFLTAHIPAMVRATNIPDLSTLELSLTEDLDTVVTSVAEADALPDIQTITILDAGGNSTVVTPYTVDTLSPAQVAIILGKPVPTYMFLGSDVVGAEELVTGAFPMTDSGAIKEVNDVALNGLTTELPNNNTGMATSDPLGLDVGAEALTIMYIGRVIDFPTTTNLFGKRQPAAGNLGWEIYNLSTGSMSFATTTPSGTKTNTVAVNHGIQNQQVIVATRSITNNIQSLYTREGSASSTRFTDSLTSTSTFAIGKGRLSGTPQRFGAIMVWVGADAEDFGELDRLTMAQTLGYE